MSNFNLNEFTTEMARSEVADKLSELWGDADRWDVASTGCVANITPIFGYLWLMVAATENKKKEDKKKMYVTKLPSKGGSCGTVDILESGGLSFPTDPQAIAQQAKEHGGVICQPTDDLAPIDKELMRVRGLTNLMTNFPLVYASVLSKRIAIGCTHCIVDVKLGQATKMLSPWMNEEQIQWLTKDYFNEQNKQKLVIDEPDILKKFKSLLSKVVGGTVDEFPDLEEKSWIEQKCENQLNQLKEVRWLLTNSGMPQCRAIGRQLILIHIDELIKKEKTDELIKEEKTDELIKEEKTDELIKEEKTNDEKIDDLLRRNDGNEYEKLYAEVLPDICGASPPSWEKLRDQWEKLKAKLPKLKLGTFTVKKYLENKDAKYSELEKSYGGEDGNDLRFITFGLYPYQLQAINPVTIQKMDAYELDKIFEWLCGENTYDPEVGIWLHKLPGEKVEAPIPIKNENNELKDEQKKHYKKLEVCGLWQEAIVSIFYRPSCCSEAEVIAKARQFLCNVTLLS